MNKPESIIYHNEVRVFQGSYEHGKQKFDELIGSEGEIKLAIYKPRYKCYVCSAYHLS